MVYLIKDYPGASKMRGPLWQSLQYEYLGGNFGDPNCGSPDVGVGLNHSTSNSQNDSLRAQG